MRADSCGSICHSGSGGRYGKKNTRLFLGLGVEDWMTLLHDLVYILGTVAVVFVFFVRVFTVEGLSMQPTLREGDQLLVLNQLWYSTPQAGDVVIARVPEFSEDPIVKRVIAVEGDVVDIDFGTGAVSVNGEILEEEYTSEPTYRDFGSMGVEFPLVVEPGCVFLLGDNRNVSYDSRYEPIGQVDTRCILGRVIFLALPGSDGETHVRDFDRIGVIH